MLRNFFALVLILALPTRLAGQSSWDRYKPGTIAGVMAANRASVLADFASGSDSNLIFSAAGFATVTTVEYQDSLRPTPPTHLRYLMGWARSFRLGFDPKAVFGREVLVREGSLLLWLPVQDTVVKVLRPQLHRGDQILLYVVFAGAQGGRGPDIDWMFIVNDIQKK